MHLGQQIMWGSLYLGVCLILQTLLLSAMFPALRSMFQWLEKSNSTIRIAVVLSAALAVIVFSHTLQIWLWAAVWVLYDILPDWNTSIYFSLVTYTSVGYGDIVLEPPVRIFGVFAAITGLLGFGISAAVLVALMSKLFLTEETDS